MTPCLVSGEAAKSPEPAEPPGPAAAAPAEPAAAATPPSLQLFNAWLQRSGYEQAEQDEWEEFEDDGAFDDAEPEDLQPAALLEWRGSDRQQERAMDRRVHEWNCSRDWIGCTAVFISTEYTAEV